jgi:hypothetical protein
MKKVGPLFGDMMFHEEIKTNPKDEMELTDHRWKKNNSLLPNILSKTKANIFNNSNDYR